MINSGKRIPLKRIFVAVITGLFLILVIFFAINMLPKKVYYGEDFGIERVKSGADFNSNGVDDYVDILLGARIDAENRPKYDGAYVEGGYPDDRVGVCTDVVWRAFKNAGYSLKAMVDKDIADNTADYPRVGGKPDPNIDFRRVPNLHIFFEKYAIALTTDISDIANWQPGDIVIFDNDKHIGVISDKRNKKGITYVIHNGGQLNREEDYLGNSKVIAHYRFDGSRLPEDLRIKW